MRKTRAARSGRAIVLGLLVGAMGTGCATNPATGRRQLSLVGEQDEIAMGRQADEEITATMGLYDDPELQGYVQALGSELAATSERPHLPWTFRVIDDPIVNAFALPGGFIYVTRGILSHLNSEAELVAVLGHEIGHVTARHAVSRLSKSQLLGVGLGVGAILSPEFRQVSDLAQLGFGLLFLKYSRGDELQADELGLRYSLRGGYDAREMAEVYTVLKKVGEASSAGRLPSWLATHPDPINRRDAIEARLAALGHDFADAKIERRSYLQRLDGLVFGEDPREGFFEGQTFLHPALEFRLAFPEGWDTQNRRQSLVAVSPDEDGLIELTLSSGADPQAAVREFFGQQGVTGGRLQSGSVNGLPAASGRFEATTQSGSLSGRVVCVRYGESTYQLLGYSSADKWRSYEASIEQSLRSFERLTDPAVLDIEPASLSIVRPRGAMTLEQFGERFPSTVPLEQIALINHLERGGSIAAGLEVKRVVGGPSR